MANTKTTPKAKIILQPETYNLLLNLLNEWLSFGDNPGNAFRKSAAYLIEKIEKYARNFKDKNENENIQIYFFDDEAAQLIEILLLSLYPFGDSGGQHFNKLKARKRQRKTTQ